MIPRADPRVKSERVTHAPRVISVVRTAHFIHAHFHERLRVNEPVTRLESGFLKNAAHALGVDSTVGVVSVWTVTFQFGRELVLTVRILLETVRERVDLVLCWVLNLVSLDIGEVIGTVAVIKTAKTNQFVIFGIQVGIRDFDDNVFYTIPKNVDTVIRLY